MLNTVPLKAHPAPPSRAIAGPWKAAVPPGAPPPDSVPLRSPRSEVSSAPLPDTEGAVSPTARRQMLVDLNTGRRRVASPAVPPVSSASGPWQGILLEQHPAGQSVECLDVMAPEHMVVVQTGAGSVFEWRDEGPFRTVTFRQGQSMFIPAMHPFSVRAPRTTDVIALALDPRFLRCVAHDLFPSPEAADLRPEVPLDDPLLGALARALLAEVRSGFPGGRAYGESLGTAMAAHLVRHYSAGPPVASEGRGLARHQVRRVVDYMAAHLDEDLSLAVLAAEAGLSPFHFARRFKLTTGVSPHRYLVRCRVERARELLLGTRSPASEIARQVGFCDQSHLTAHFRRMFGVTPMEFRRRTIGVTTEGAIQTAEA